jgi:Tfp pilus assembly protein PilO
MHNFTVKPLGETGKLTMNITAKTYRYFDEKE